MHKTLYIDTDEEITSIIDRLRKTVEKELIIVAPKNAMLLQSIVNLKLLKKEADRRKKQLLIITQDKIGKKLIEKAGILAQAKPGKDLYLDAQPDEQSYEPMYAEEASEIKEELQKEEEGKPIGSSEYFDELVIAQSAQAEEIAPVKQKSVPKKEKKMPLAPPKKKKIEKPKINMSDIVISRPPAREKKTKKAELPLEKPEPEIVISEGNAFSDSYAESNAAAPKMSQVSIKKAEKFFRGSRRLRKDLEIAKVGGGAKKYFLVFAGVFLLLGILAAAYFLFPKATLALQVKNQEKTASVDLTADAQASVANTDSGTIPANFEQTVKETTEDFSASGSKSGGAKATGQVVIYNEFSNQDQPLVATTRLETSDGKIFRITKDITVPGQTTVGGDTKPGAIEVDVVADQPGESSNIGPSDFKITGFKDMPAKYDKFYAKSAEAMKGGSSNGGAKAITDDDITSAKQKISADAKKAAVEEIKSNISQDRKIFDDAVQIDVLNVATSDNAGSEKEKFTATAKVRVSALSFSEADVKKILQNNLVQSGASAGEIAFANTIAYTLADSNLGQKILKFQAKTDARVSSGLDVENFKKGILGKTAADAQAYAKNFSSIEKMDISFWPFFLSHIPMSERRVVVEVK